MPNPKKDKVKLKKQNRPRQGLDPESLEEYHIEDLPCILVRADTQWSGPTFPPGQLTDCKLTTLTLPSGMRRIHEEEVYGNLPTGKGPFGPSLADPPAPDQPVYLHLLYEVDLPGGSPITKPGDSDLVQAIREHSDDDSYSVCHLGVTTPCARSFVSTTGQEAKDLSLIVEWDWAAHYYKETTTGGATQVTPLGLALKGLLGSEDPVKMIALIIPDRSIVWVPFAANADDETTFNKQKYVPGDPYNLEALVFLDKPSIWLESKLMFTL